MIFAEKKKQSTGILPTENQVLGNFKKRKYTPVREISRPSEALLKMMTGLNGMNVILAILLCGLRAWISFEPIWTGNDELWIHGWCPSPSYPWRNSRLLSSCASLADWRACSIIYCDEAQFWIKDPKYSNACSPLEPAYNVQNRSKTALAAKRSANTPASKNWKKPDINN